MVVSGYTADSYTADSVAKSFICFFPADSVEDVPEYDSTMFKYQPAVIARAETNGIFIAQNLKPIPYRSMPSKIRTTTRFTNLRSIR
mgnify:FL=1